ncbi:MAG: ATP-binding protein [Desulfatiglandaceae bacterium]
MTAELDHLEGLIAFVRDSARAAGFAPNRIREIELATEEALVNIFRYAYPEATGMVRVNCPMEGGRLFAVEITDNGIPFNSLDFPDPDMSADLDDRHIGGLGVFLMKKLTNDHTYRRKGNQNILTLVFENAESIHE